MVDLSSRLGQWIVALEGLNYIVNITNCGMAFVANLNRLGMTAECLR